MTRFRSSLYFSRGSRSQLLGAFVWSPAEARFYSSEHAPRSRLDEAIQRNLASGHSVDEIVTRVRRQSQGPHFAFSEPETYEGLSALDVLREVGRATATRFPVLERHRLAVRRGGGIFAPTDSSIDGQTLLQRLSPQAHRKSIGLLRRGLIWHVEAIVDLEGPHPGAYLEEDILEDLSPGWSSFTARPPLVLRGEDGRLTRFAQSVLDAMAHSRQSNDPPNPWLDQLFPDLEGESVPEAPHGPVRNLFPSVFLVDSSGQPTTAGRHLLHLHASRLVCFGYRDHDLEAMVPGLESFFARSLGEPALAERLADDARPVSFSEM